MAYNFGDKPFKYPPAEGYASLTSSQEFQHSPKGSRELLNVINLDLYLLKYIYKANTKLEIIRIIEYYIFNDIYMAISRRNHIIVE